MFDRIVILDIYPHNSLDDVMSQIVEREVLECLTYLTLEQQVAKGHFIIIEHVTLWKYERTILNFTNWLTSLNAALGLTS